MIRPYSTDDKTQLIKLLRCNTPQYFDKTEEQDFIKYLDNEIETYFVAELDKKIVGCGGINYENLTKAVISWDIIHPDYQGQGIGKKLLWHRIKEIKKNKCINSLGIVKE